jgi:hypothetical protein
VQIKSGSSYVSPDGTRHFLRSDKHHFQYWSDHLLPIAAIVYDPRTSRAAWKDVTRYLREHPESASDGPFSIPIPSTQEFCVERFPEFRDHFLAYQDEYRQEANFGLAIEKFADVDDIEGCLDGIRSLFSFHRQRFGSWFVLISSFRFFRGHPLSSTLVAVLCHIPGHPDIFWHSGNIVEQSVENAAMEMIRERFGREEMLVLLEAVDEDGFQRGSIGQAAHSIIVGVRNRNQLLESIAFDANAPEPARFHALLLLIFHTQERHRDSVTRCRNYVGRYANDFPGGDFRDVLAEIDLVLREFGAISLY